MDNISRIEQWSIVCLDEYEYVAPENKSRYVRGYIYGHTKHLDGTQILTSRIIQMIKEDGVITVITNSGSRYMMGEPKVEYVKWCTENGYSYE